MATTMAFSNMKKENIIDAMQKNMILHMTYFANNVPTVKLQAQKDVAIVHAEINDDMFNYVLAAHFTPEDAKERIKEVIAHYSRLNLPFSWWVGPQDTPHNLDVLLMAEGLALKEDDVGMALDLTHFDAAYESPLSFERVNNQKLMRDFADIIVSIGGNPDAYEIFYSKIPASLLQEGAALEMYVGYLDGTPVITGILVFHADVAGIYYVATNPDYRKRGYGTAMMLHLIRRAQNKGYTLSTLTASREGKNLYARLGFKEYCVFREFARPHGNN